MDYIPLKNELSRLFSHEMESIAKVGGALSGFVSPTVTREDGDTVLPDEALCTAARNRGLDPYRMIILLLKARWELHLAHTMGFEETKDVDFGLLFRDRERGEADLSSFKPDIPGMLCTIRRYGVRTVTSEVFDHGSEKNTGIAFSDKELGILVQEIVLNRLFLHSLTSPLIASFIEKKEQERRVIGRADEALAKEFWLAKCVWIELSEEVAELLLVLEASRLANGYIVKEFLITFGDVYVRMKEEVTRLLDLERRIMLKEANPLWSASDIEEKVSELERAEEEKLLALEMDSLLVASLDELSPGKSIDDEALNDYRGRVKKSLREIFFLLHPHRLARHPGFEKLTKDQREHLRALWENVMEIKQVDLRYTEGTVGRSLHSLEKLASIRDTAKKILEHSGLDVNVDYIIIGETIGERISWLNREIGQLEMDVQLIKSEIIMLANDEDVLEKKAIVTSPGKHEEVKSEMMVRTEAIKKEADSLESKLALLFGSGA